MLFGMTACGSNDTAKDNAVNDATEGNNTEQDLSLIHILSAGLQKLTERCRCLKNKQL